VRRVRASVTRIFSKMIVLNAVQLISKSAKHRRTVGSVALDRVGPAADAGEMVSGLERAVIDEINYRAVDLPDLSHVVSDRVVAGAEEEAEQVRAFASHSCNACSDVVTIFAVGRLVFKVGAGQCARIPKRLHAFFPAQGSSGPPTAIVPPAPHALHTILLRH